MIRSLLGCCLRRVGVVSGLCVLLLFGTTEALADTTKDSVVTAAPDGTVTNRFALAEVERLVLNTTDSKVQDVNYLDAIVVPVDFDGKRTKDSVQLTAPIERLYLTRKADARTMTVWQDATSSGTSTAITGVTELFFPRQTQCLQLIEWQADGALFTTARGMNIAGSGNAQVYIGGKAAAETTVQTDSVGIFRLPLAVGDDHVGESLVVIWTPEDNVTNNHIGVYIGKIPFRSNSSKARTDGSDVVVLKGDNLKMSTPAKVGTLTINPGACLMLTGTGTLTVDTLIVRANAPQDQYGQLWVGEKVTLGTSTIYLDYELDAQSMYTFAVPGAVNLTELRFPIICEKLNGTGEKPAIDQDYYIDYFDGNKRATDEAHKGFSYYSIDTKGATLNRGTGYTIAAEPQLWGSDVRTTSTLRFPISLTDYSPSAAATLPVSAYGDTDTPSAHRGWNFLGNPFFGGVHGGGDASGTTIEYYTVPSNRGIYAQVRATDFQLLPFHAFFVQTENSGSLVFATGQQVRLAPARYSATESGEQAIDIRLTDGTDSDQTEMRISEAFDATYEFNADLAKWEDARPVSLYTLLGSTRLAYHATSPDEARRAIPVGYRTRSLKPMTFSLVEAEDNLQFAAVNLYDRATRQTTNLLFADYTFTPAQKEDDTRFTLSCIPLAQTPTGASEVRIGIEGDGIRLYGVSDEVRIYDELGHLHYCGGTDETIQLPHGIYLVCLTNAAKVLKVVL